MPADFEQSLLNLAELYWEVDPDLSRFDKAPLWLRRIRVLIDAGFDDGREGADFYARPIDDLWSLLAELSVPVFNPFTGHDEAHPSLGRREFRRWLRRMDLLHDLGGVGKVVGEVGPDLVGGRRLFPVIRLAEQLHDETADMEMFHGLAWLANQLDPVSSNISLSYLTDMIADIEGRADGHAPPPDVHRLVELVARARGFLGQVDGDPKRALEAIWNADRRWEWTKNRLTELEDTALDDDDEQMAEWAMRLLFDFEDARSVVVRGPVESQARLNAVVLTPFVTRIAERFGGGWREVAAEIGLGDGTGLPADFEQSLENLAELYWETDPDLYEFYNALPGMRRLRLLIDVGFDDGREGAAFYKRKVDDLRTLAAELSGLVVNPQAGQQELRSTAEIRRWLGRMDLVHDLGGVGAVVGEIGADLVSGRRLLPVIRMAEELYGKRVGVERLRGLAWLANQFDPQSSNISQASLDRMAVGFEGRADGHASPSDVHRLVELAGRARGFLGQVDGDPKGALEAIWKADRRWERTADRLTVIEETARGKHDEQLAEWARGLLAGFEDARSVVVREPVESQARLNAVVLAPFVTRIAERFGGGWREVAAEIGLGAGTGLPADYRQAVLNLAELYWEVDPDLSRFDKAPLWLRRIRVLIDAGFDDGRQGADFYARTVDDLRSLVADLPDNPQTGQHEPRSPVAVGAAEIRRWLERMDLVHDLGGAGAVVGEVGADLLGGRRLFPVIELAEHLYGKRPGTEMLRGLAWLANQFDPQSSNISQASLARMAAGFEGRADGHASPSDVRRLVELAGSGREFLGQVDGDPK
ncbi:hypothetical protein, partial [Saccharopolyspora spinosa]|uniref:hypothetical protein n=1 Tax=Saccharopolyspora spinosa TaxID=60894 RepID=UPI00178C27C0